MIRKEKWEVIWLLIKWASALWMWKSTSGVKGIMKTIMECDNNCEEKNSWRSLEKI